LSFFFKKKKNKNKIKQLLEEHMITPEMTWKEATRLISIDPRYLALPSGKKKQVIKFLIY